MRQLDKNRAISEAGKATQVRHRNMVCKTFKFKVNQSSLSYDQKEALKMYFIEAKRGTVDLKPRKKISYDKCKDLFKDRKLSCL